MSDAQLGQTLGLIFEERTRSPLERSPTFAQICLQTFTIMKRNGSDSVHLLTPISVTPEEFDYHADRLIENIVRLKREARERFTRTRKSE